MDCPVTANRPAWRTAFSRVSLIQYHRPKSIKANMSRRNRGRTRANSTAPSPWRSIKICILRDKFPTLSLKLTAGKKTSHRMFGWRSQTPSSGSTQGAMPERAVPRTAWNRPADTSPLVLRPSPEFPLLHTRYPSLSPTSSLSATHLTQCGAALRLSPIPTRRHFSTDTASGLRATKNKARRLPRGHHP